MKKYIKFIFILFVFFYVCPVFAIQHITSEIIPISEVATVNTDTLLFYNMSYVSKVSGKDYGQFKFEYVKNNTDRKEYVGADILLFDMDKKNIGFLTYCSGNDVGSDYAQLELKGGDSSPFSINVTKKYFMEGKDSTNVSYYAILDANPYCQDGGYEKYVGLTMEEITNRRYATEKSFFDVSSLLDRTSLESFLRAIIFTFVSAFISGFFLNPLYKSMFNYSTVASYMPFFSHYVAMKLAFGEKLAKVYFASLIVSFLLLCFRILSSLYYLLIVVGFIALAIDIYKLVSRKYSMFYFETYKGNVADDSTDVALNTFHSIEKVFGLYDEGDEVEDEQASDDVTIIDEDDDENANAYDVKVSMDESDKNYSVKSQEQVDKKQELPREDNGNFNVDDLFYADNDKDYFSSNEEEKGNSDVFAVENSDSAFDKDDKKSKTVDKIFEEDDDIAIDFDPEKSVSKEIEKEKSELKKEKSVADGESDLMNLFK